MHEAAHNSGRKPELPAGYRLEAESNNRLLKRPNGSLVAAFTEGVALESILRVAEADERHMRAVKRQERFSSEADSETVFLFAEDVKEARSEYLSALEAVFRG
ncbi:MAG: hypothetical protein M3317_10700 [Actinomycetota bacterium]|nr:hypothetical protein [Actinomycetota bacterium]